jgi:tetratricopeptide (TPR) repeat protein
VFLYTWPLASSLADVAVPAAVLACLLVAAVAGTVRRHPLAFPVAAFFLVLAPSSSVLPIVTEVAAEHRMYLPLASLVACAVIGVYLAGTILLARRGTTAWLARAATAAAAVGALGVMLALGLVTRERNRDFWDEERLWRDTVEKQPDNARARVAYGEALASMRKLDEAESQLRAAVDLAPGDGVALVRLGTVQAAQGRLDDAIATLERALIARPDDVDAHRALGEAYAIRRSDARAVAHYERVVARFPEDAAMLGRLAALLADSRDPMVRDGARAERLAERAAALTSRSEPSLLEVLAVAQAATGRFAEATVTTEEAIAVSRARGLGAVAAQLERRAEAYRALTAAGAPR